MQQSRLHHLLHVRVQNRQLRRLRRGHRRHHLAEFTRLRHAHSPARRARREQSPVRRIVTREQQPPPRQRRTRHVRQRRLVQLRRRQRQHHMKRRALALAALRPNAAVHQLHQILGNRQPQTRPAKPPRRRGIHLHERLEQPLQRRPRNANPRVPHREMHLAQVLRPRLRHPRRHHNFAARGELDRVAEQIQKHLPQPREIADHPRRHVVRQLARQVQTLLRRLRCEQIQRALDALPQLQRLPLQLHFPAFDFREIQDVVDLREQRLAALANRLDQLALLARHRRLEQQIRHRNHAIHRRAQLVTHVREKL